MVTIPFTETPYEGNLCCHSSICEAQFLGVFRVARNPSWLIDISGSRCHLGFLHSPLENIPWESDETPPLLCLNLPKINLGEMKCQSWSLRKKTIWKNSAIYLHPSFAPGESVVAATACFLLLMVSPDAVASWLIWYRYLSMRFFRPSIYHAHIQPL